MQVQGTALCLSDSVEFLINTYRNPAHHRCSLTVEVNRFSGRSDVFSRFFADIVECLSKADLLCDASSEYPKGQFNCGAADVVDELAVHGSPRSGATSAVVAMTKSSTVCRVDRASLHVERPSLRPCWISLVCQACLSPKARVFGDPSSTTDGLDLVEEMRDELAGAVPIFAHSGGEGVFH